MMDWERKRAAEKERLRKMNRAFGSAGARMAAMYGPGGKEKPDAALKASGLLPDQEQDRLSGVLNIPD